MMRTLIIPDIHNQTGNADAWLSTVQADRVVFLGDYFDDFRDSPEIAAETAKWLRQTVETRHDWIFLLGNHDMPYLFPFDERFLLPGFTREKQKAIAAVVRGMDRSRFRLHVWLDDDVLLTHAGLHNGWLPQPERAAAEELLAEAEASVLKGQWHPLLSWGQDRGGMKWQPRVGGIIWADWKSLSPLPFCHQIFGHTPGRFVRHRTVRERSNVCVDVQNAKAAALLHHRESILDRSARRLEVLEFQDGSIMAALTLDLP